LRISIINNFGISVNDTLGSFLLANFFYKSYLFEIVHDSLILRHELQQVNPDKYGFILQQDDYVIYNIHKNIYRLRYGQYGFGSTDFSACVNLLKEFQYE